MQTYHVKKFLINTLLLCFALPLFSAAYALDLSAIDLPAENFTLDNGLQVVVQSDHSVPKVVVGVFYRVGSQHDPKGKEGLAHLFEHLMFRGSKHHQQPFSEAIKSMGGGKQGVTSQDWTKYYETVPSPGLERVLWLEADRMAYLLDVLDEAKLNEERAIVLNERANAQDRTRGKISPAMFQALYPIDHPYRTVPIGTVESLNNITLADAHAFFQKYYSPNNAVLLILGDVTEANAKNLSEKYFASITPGKGVSRISSAPVERHINSTEVIYGSFKHPGITRDWLLPGHGQLQTSYAEIAAAAMAMDVKGTLAHTLMSKLGIASYVNVSVLPYQLSSRFRVQVELKDEQDLVLASKLIDQAMLELAEKGVDVNTLNIARKKMAIERTFKLDYLGGRLKLLGSSASNLGDPQAYKKIYGAMQSAGPKDIRRVASVYLQKGYHQITTLPHRSDKAAAETLDRALMPPVGEVDNPTVPKIETSTLNNGIVLKNVHYEMLQSVRINFNFAHLASIKAAGNPAAPAVAFQMLDHGSLKLQGSAFNKALSANGIELNNEDVTSEMILEATTIGALVPATVDIMADLLLNPAFTQASFDTVREEMRKRRQTRGTDLIDIAVQKIFGKEHTYAAMWTVESLDRLTLADVKESYAKLIQPANMSITAAGGVSKEVLITALNRSLGAKQGNKTGFDAGLKKMTKKTSSPIVAKPEKMKIYLLDQPGAKQASLYLMAILPGRAYENRSALNMANMIFGGTSTSRLNKKLRVEKGLSYGVRSRVALSVPGQSMLKIGGSVQGDKAAEAMSEIVKLMAAIRSSHPPTQAELDYFRDGEIRFRKQGIGSNMDMLSYLNENRRFKLKDDRLTQQISGLQSISLEQVKQQLEEHFNPNNVLWFIKGDLALIENDIRALNMASIEVLH